MNATFKNKDFLVSFNVAEPLRHCRLVLGARQPRRLQLVDHFKERVSSVFAQLVEALLVLDELLLATLAHGRRRHEHLQEAYGRVVDTDDVDVVQVGRKKVSHRLGALVVHWPLDRRRPIDRKRAVVDQRVGGGDVVGRAQVARELERVKLLNVRRRRAFAVQETSAERLALDALLQSPQRGKELAGLHLVGLEDVGPHGPRGQHPRSDDGKVVLVEGLLGLGRKLGHHFQQTVEQNVAEKRDDRVKRGNVVLGRVVCHVVKVPIELFVLGSRQKVLVPVDDLFERRAQKSCEPHAHAKVDLPEQGIYAKQPLAGGHLEPVRQLVVAPLKPPVAQVEVGLLEHQSSAVGAQGR